jgi:hypothetical protein
MFRCAINHLQGGRLVFLLKARKQLMLNRQNELNLRIPSISYSKTTQQYGLAKYVVLSITMSSPP